MTKDLQSVQPQAGVTEPAPSWSELAALTPARVALGRSGVSLPTHAVLDFSLAHARARDAVHAQTDMPRLRAELEAQGWPVIEVASAAPNRAAYLARPDWGRRLEDASRRRLAGLPATAVDLVFVVSDGLSAHAVHQHAAALLRQLRPRIAALRLAPLVLATQARVALADEVGEALGARVAISLIGERPGLSSPHSLGLYVTANPRVGCSDAQRECISNVHAAGLAYADAADQFSVLIDRVLTTGASGVALQQRPAVR